MATGAPVTSILPFADAVPLPARLPSALEWYAIVATLLCVGALLVALVKWAAPRWVRETAKPPSDRPSPMPAALTTTGGGSAAVHHELGEHESTLTHLLRTVEGLATDVRAWRDDHVAIKDALGALAGTVEDLRQHHERCGNVPIPRRVTGMTGQFAVAASEDIRSSATHEIDPPVAVPRQRIPSRGGQR